MDLEENGIQAKSKQEKCHLVHVLYKDRFYVEKCLQLSLPSNFYYS